MFELITCPICGSEDCCTYKYPEEERYVIRCLICGHEVGGKTIYDVVMEWQRAADEKTKE